MLEYVVDSVKVFTSVLVSILVSLMLEDREGVSLIFCVMVEWVAATVECSVLRIVGVFPLDFVLVDDTALAECELCVFVDSTTVAVLSVTVLE